MVFSKLDACPSLLSSPLHYTLTHLAEHLNSISHDTIHGYLRRETLTPRLLWEQVVLLLVPTPDAYLVFDDTVLDKRFAQKIQLVCRLYSGPEDHDSRYWSHYRTVLGD